MKNQLTPINQIGFFHLPNKLPKLKKLTLRIKKNEGFKNRAYKDQLGNLTIGFGHLIKKDEKQMLTKKYSKKTLHKIFINDLNLAIKKFKKYYNKDKLPVNAQEVIIEMIFQLGIRNVLMFKKFNLHIKKKEYYLAALEMIDSKWNKQTPKRVSGLISILLGFND